MASGLKKGYFQIYTGNGKGKTTAALGLALRAHGAGLKVTIIQFMKGMRYSEVDSLEKLGIGIHQYGAPTLVDKCEPSDDDSRFAEEAFLHCMKEVEGSLSDILICDEINCAIDFGLLGLSKALKLVDKKAETMELVFTGRYAAPELLKRADLVTEMKEVTHYYSSGIQARKGVEF